MPRKKPPPKRKPAPKPVPELKAEPQESAAESLFRATYGREMTAAERRRTISKSKPVSLDDWMKEK
ncbi:MAG TPA: hypothetical protein VFU76_09565 [Terriglobales bacterium]|nr:hypothetical protein [Terriglobales bacterium]